MGLTEEQSVVIDAWRSGANVLVNALAGTGKTTVLKALGGMDTLYVSYNRALCDEVDWPGPKGTTHSLAMKIYHAATGRRPVPQSGKLRNLLKSMRFQRKEEKAISEYVSAKLQCREPTHTPARGLEVWARYQQLWHEGVFDFDDFIYLLAVGIIPIPSGWLGKKLVGDEFQDWNRAQLLFLKALRPAQIICTGDVYQTIYQFRGADSMARHWLTEAFNMTECPLTLSQRCPAEVVRYVQDLVPQFRAAKSGGKVQFTAELDLEASDVVLSYRNAPLMQVALQELEHGTSVHWKGKDVLKSVRGILKRYPTLVQLHKLAENKEAEGSWTDLVQTALTLMMKHGGSAEQVLTGLEKTHSAPVTLSTIHGAKGQTFDKVTLLIERELDPNLHYVGATRAAEQLLIWTPTL